MQNAKCRMQNAKLMWAFFSSQLLQALIGNYYKQKTPQASGVFL